MNPIPHPSTTIVITSRNRPEILRKTIATVRQSPLRELPIIVVDDASEEPPRLDDLGGGILLHRNHERVGYVESRTWANHRAETEYVLSLDDDSWPESGDFFAAERYLSERDDLLALAFPIRNPGGRWQLANAGETPYAVKGFIGCAHLMNLRHFRALGGYSPAVIHQGEEFELAARGAAAGLRCLHYPGFIVHHEHTGVSRDMDRVLFHYGRNRARLIRAFSPSTRTPWLLFKAFVESLLFAARHRRSAPFRGWWTGVGEPIDARLVARFDTGLWQRWSSLPHA